MTYWIGDVLGRVADACAAEETPLLSALCVSAGGTVGDGYAVAVERVRGERPADPEMHAARERLACYAACGADLPADGGRPTLTPAEKKRRAAPAQRSTAPKAKVCPGCHMQMPLKGVCDTCG